MSQNLISSDFPFQLSRIKTLDVEMAFVDTAPEWTSERKPVVLFLHDNPTSSYLWRNIIPYASDHTRCIAPDLIGMGESDKPSHLAYRFNDHALYLDEFIAAVIPRTQSVVLVVQGWGSALGFHWARRNSYRVAGLTFMEFIPPLAWSQLEGDRGPSPFRMFRDPEVGRKLIIDENFFIEKFLPGGVVRSLTAKEMQHYRAPYLEPSTRETLYRWPQEAAIDGQPADVAAIVEAYHTWLMESEVSKLFFYATPGAIIGPELAQHYRQLLKNTRSVDVGVGKHWFIEDNPHLIGNELGKWLEELSP